MDERPECSNAPKDTLGVDDEQPPERNTLVLEENTIVPRNAVAGISTMSKIVVSDMNCEI